MRELQLVDGVCVQEVWGKDPKDGRDQSEWKLIESCALVRDGKALGFIPSVFHGPTGSVPETGKLPLANLDHYRLDADYKHGLHFAALPTAWVSGFDKGFAFADWVEHGLGV